MKPKSSLVVALFLCAVSTPLFHARSANAKKTVYPHLLAAYCGANPSGKKLKKIMAIYREIIPVAAPHGSYTTVAFKGGYVGLVADKKGGGGNQINFSIWRKDAKPIASANPKYGTVKTRQFTGEGIGWAGRLAYPWKAGERYHVYINVKHENGKTIYSAWFGSVAKGDWLLAGRTEKSGTLFLGHAGGFLENPGKPTDAVKRIPRITGYGATWVHGEKRWHACTQVSVKVSDPNNAKFFERKGVVYIELCLGVKSDLGRRHTYSIKATSENPPALPEKVQGA